MNGSETSDIMTLQEQYVLGTYSPSMRITRGSMSWVWDDTGRRYLDFGVGISVCNLGHCHPAVTEAIQRQAATLVHVSNLYYNNNQPRLASLIAQNSFGGKVFFCNSGAEANEGLIKLARKWGNERGRNEIICMRNSFHGRTLATLAATGRAKYRKGFEPDMPGFTHVPFNDLTAVSEAVTPRTAAVLVEPIQGEGGVVPAERAFLAGLSSLCAESGILLMFDEVQCGMGRTGCYFAAQHYGVEPDAMSMAKALANGFPLGAFEVKEHLADVLAPGTHASTFGGNPLACAAGVAVFETFAREHVLDNCREMSIYLGGKLAELKKRHNRIREIRGVGLMVGMEVDGDVSGIMAKARESGLLILSAGENVVRLMPPLTVQPDEIDLAADILDQALKQE